ncbi:MAG: transglutaminase family protein [Actinobacteria bacterium]|nr:transglutaminase family protein [Actinomycetota bacterium]
MRYRIVHRTTYEYGLPATMCFNLAHLGVRSTPVQRVESTDLSILPTPDDRLDRVDAFGNATTYFSIERPHSALEVTAVHTVDRCASSPPPSASSRWEEATLTTALADRELMLASPHVPLLAELKAYAETSFSPGRPLLEAAAELVSRIFHDFVYQPGFTTVSTPLGEVLEHRRGVCQDFAHVALGCLRSVGLAARYVSGYLETIPPPGVDKVFGADASHAWCAVRLADGRWLDLDPTNDQVAPSTHVTLGWGRDYGDVVPLKGVVFSAGGSTDLAVQVDVARIGDDRVPDVGG